jgi:glycosyltransferase involved in cell wall biosynthesis
MPFFPMLVNSFNKQTKNNKVDLVISSSWALGKGYRIGNETHISYLHCRNFKYVWDEAYLYFRGPLKILSFLKKPLQKFDIQSSKVPDHIITNSIFVQKWVKEKYYRSSTVIYPPVEVDDFYISKEKKDYYITVGRIVKCKRFEIIVDAFNKNGKELIIVGDGSARKGLEKQASSNIKFIGFKTKDEFKDILAKAKAFVFAAEEDFGIAIVEALAAGVPVVAYRGGASEELINEETGILYKYQSESSLNNALYYFEKNLNKFKPELIRESSLRFSKSRFKKEIKVFIDNIIQTELNKSNQ